MNCNFNFKEYNKEISYFPTRMLVVQTFYSIQIRRKVRQLSSSLINIIQSSINFSNKNFIENFQYYNLKNNFFNQIVFKILKNQVIIDNFINKTISHNWSIKRISKVTYSILSCGLYEKIILKYSFKKLLINDYLQITKALGHVKDIGFINKILDI